MSARERADARLSGGRRARGPERGRERAGHAAAEHRRDPHRLRVALPQPGGDRHRRGRSPGGPDHRPRPAGAHASRPTLRAALRRGRGEHAHHDRAPGAAATGARDISPAAWSPISRRRATRVRRGRVRCWWCPPDPGSLQLPCPPGPLQGGRIGRWGQPGEAAPEAGRAPGPTSRPSRACSRRPPARARRRSTGPPGGTYTLSWTAATDPVTPSSGIVYDIFFAASPGGENFSSPTWTTAPGATAYSGNLATSGPGLFRRARARRGRPRGHQHGRAARRQQLLTAVRCVGSADDEVRASRRHPAGASRRGHRRRRRGGDRAGLARAALAVKLGGEVRDLARPLPTPNGDAAGSGDHHRAQRRGRAGADPPRHRARARRGGARPLPGGQDLDRARDRRRLLLRLRFPRRRRALRRGLPPHRGADEGPRRRRRAVRARGRARRGGARALPCRGSALQGRADRGPGRQRRS